MSLPRQIKFHNEVLPRIPPSRTISLTTSDTDNDPIINTSRRRKNHQSFNSSRSPIPSSSYKNNVAKSPDFLSAKRKKIIRRSTITRKNLSPSFKTDIEQASGPNNNNLSSDKDSLFSNYNLDRDDDATI